MAIRGVAKATDSSDREDEARIDDPAGAGRAEAAVRQVGDQKRERDR